MKATQLISGLTFSLLGMAAPAIASADFPSHRPARTGAVFTMSNEAEGNRVIAFARASDGSLTAPRFTPTSGLGSGDSLGSQSALSLTGDGRHLLVTNPGSDELSVFAVDGARVRLVERVASGGKRPVSVAESDGVVYVLHSGGTPGIQGFWLSRSGRLTPIPGSAQALSRPDANPAQVAISPSGRDVIVTEKGTQTIATFPLNGWGRTSPGRFVHAAGSTPFGFDVSHRGDVVVSEAGAGGLSRYAFEAAHQLSLVEGPVSDGQRAACWVAISPDDRYAFTTNAGSGTISAYALGRHGELTLVDGVAGETGPTSAPLDLDFDRRGEHLYVLTRGTHTLDSFAVDGPELTLEDESAQLPPFTSGVASY